MSLAEYLSDRFFGTHAQVDLEDTLLDMFLGLVGGLSFLVANRLLAPASLAPTTRADTPDCA
jgi:hypothetical protein